MPYMSAGGKPFYQRNRLYIILLVSFIGLSWLMLPVSWLDVELEQILPPMYRSMLLITLGIYLFALSLQVLANAGIEFLRLIQYESSNTESSFVQLLRSLRLLSFWLTALTLFWMVIFTLIRDQQQSFGQHPQSLADLDEAFVILMSCVSFAGVAFYIMRQNSNLLALMSYLISTAVYSPMTQQTKLSQILFADVLTSYSRAFRDLSVIMCSFLTSYDLDSYQSSRCNNSIFVFTLISTPYLIRLRQCVADYRCGQKHQFWNGLKYCSILPVLVCAYLLRIFNNVDNSYILAAWFVSAIFNSSFSLYWDVFYDWELGQRRFGYLRQHLLVEWHHFIVYPLLDIDNKVMSTLPLIGEDQNDLVLLSPRRAGQHTIASGSSKLQSSHSLYYALCLFNFLARFSWLIKIMIEYYGYNLHPNWSMYTLMIVEILRRNVWLIFRVERSYVNTVHQSNTE
ncbi:hypothetical protein MP228_005291 [Amoeboaphelidium protococcarum]|nr:hypothetical protein MP228_005291 [Amoeboaphelidium protococcarum]